MLDNETRTRQRMLSQLRRRAAGSSRRIQTDSADRMPAADPERALDTMHAIEQTMLFTVRWIQTGSSSGARRDAHDRATIRATMLSQLRQDLRTGSGAQRSTGCPQRITAKRGDYT